MGARFRSWWQIIKSPMIIGVIAVSVLLVALIVVEVILYGTGFKGKTLWDWMQLLIIPAVLLLASSLFTFTVSRNERKAANRHNQTEREIALDNQRETALHEYIGKMSELLLHESLRKSKEDDEVRTIARVRSLTVLPSLDGGRKRSVLQFLYESGLIENDKTIIDLQGADLSGANLYGATLNVSEPFEVSYGPASLRAARLDGANLSNASLSGVIFRDAHLQGALQLHFFGETRP